MTPMPVLFPILIFGFVYIWSPSGSRFHLGPGLALDSDRNRHPYLDPDAVLQPYPDLEPYRYIDAGSRGGFEINWSGSSCVSKARPRTHRGVGTAAQPGTGTASLVPCAAGEVVFPRAHLTNFHPCTARDNAARRKRTRVPRIGPAGGG
ncbi:hypothetical protein EVAR_38960_1 [Eumeta japonica]|uniref:Uncharacterized protein n=1 Tax=Eumeta variegata TaxID=151549 RepID=A0A4C1WA12_EUMVA|nr:hypothetical protein EVAR_38960_1 [Eumeta japonica]